MGAIRDCIYGLSIIILGCHMSRFVHAGMYVEAINEGFTNYPLSNPPDFFTEDRGRGWTGNPQLCNGIAYLLYPSIEIERMGVEWMGKVYNPLSQIIHRFPDQRADDFASWDELIGHAIFASNVKLVYETLQKRDWYISESRDLKWWYGRNLGFVQYVKYRAGVKLGWMSELAYAAALIVGSVQNSPSGHQMLWAMNQQLRDKGLSIITVAQAVHVSIMNRKYPYGPSQLLEKYYGKDHIFVKYSKDKTWLPPLER